MAGRPLCGPPPSPDKARTPPLERRGRVELNYEEYDMDTSEVLYRAADLVEERGWAFGPNGWPTEGSSAPVCIEGAIMAAQGWSWNPEGPSDSLCEVDTCLAGRAVHAYLDIDGYLFQWNDKTGRTAEQVVEVLRSAALLEAAHEFEMARP